MAKKNPHIGRTLDEHIRERMKDPEFAELYASEARRLQLASEIRKMRENSSLSQTELAHKTGMKQPAIARLERGERMPDIATLDRIGRSCGLRLDVKFVRERKAARSAQRSASRG